MFENDEKPTNFFEPDPPDGVSKQDRAMAGMTLEELRQFRLQAARLSTQGGKHARQHNQYRNQTIDKIAQGVRLTNADLKALIKDARGRAGIGAAELIEFTLGDTERNRELAKTLDAMVLNTYLANVKKAANNFTGGITPQQVINLSRAVDIRRANEQIHLASLYKRSGNVFYFLTNAGIGSKDQNHKVTVELLAYPELLVNTTTAPSMQRVRDVLKNGKIRFDCDCGRHQYWYRYIATIGKYNFGIDENRYPSTRNPNLTGVGCKHTLRVMNHLMSGMMVAKVREHAAKDLAKAANRDKSHIRRKVQVEREVERQAIAMNQWNGRLHWARKVKKVTEKAERAIKAEVKKQAAKNPNEPTTYELDSYRLAQKELKRTDIPDRAKAAHKKMWTIEIKEFEKKWGKEWR